MSLLDANNFGKIVTLGGCLYAVDRDWLQWPTSAKKGFVSQIAVNSNRHLYILNRGNPIVQVFNDSGILIREFNSPHASHGHAIYINSLDELFIVDSDRHCIHKYDSDFNYQMTIGQPDRPSYGAPFNHPTDVATNSKGDIFVSDGYGNSHIHKFSAEGEYLTSWGGYGKSIGQFSNPHSIWCLQDDTLLVADRENCRVERYNSDGEWVETFCELHHPTEICQSKDGTIFITDLTPRISAYSPSGEDLGRCRTFGAIGHGVASDAYGDVYVADMMPNAITRFRKIES
jgi:peptidylglycine monooxygenase